jgi:hypothetical protein
MPGFRLIRLLFILRAPLVFFALFLGIPSLHAVSLFRGFTDLNPADTIWVSIFAALYMSANVAIANLSLLYADYRLFGRAEPDGALEGLIAFKTQGIIPGPASKLLNGGLNPPHRFIVFWVGFLAYLWFGYSTVSQNPQAASSRLSFYLFWLVGTAVAGLVVVLVTRIQMRQTGTILIDGRTLPAGPFLVIPFFTKHLQAIYEKPPVRWNWLARPSRWIATKIRIIISRAIHRFPGLDKFFENFETGLILRDPQGVGIILPGHILAILLFFVSLLMGTGMWSLGGFAEYNPFAANLFFHTSTMIQVLIILTFLLWLFGAVGFIIDRYPLTIIPVVAVAIVLIGSFSNTDHVFETVRGRQAASLFKPPRTLVVVSAAGGGIQAAGWTATVLNSLGGRPGFREHLGLVSSVSGGSVGSYAFLAGYFPKVGRDDSQQLVEAAMDSSLEVVAWGLAHKDLAALLNPLAGINFGPADRGVALERSFVGHLLERKGHGLSSQDVNPLLTADMVRPRTDASQNVQFPVWLINSTSASRGRPVVFANDVFPSPASKNQAGILNLNDIASGYDVKVATAVRMSASFPYVSPAARPCPECSSDYLVDGGYYDNYGIVSVITWLREQDPPPDNILVIKIDSFPPDQDTKQKSEDWKYQFIAPILALYNSKSSGQANRDLQELDLMSQVLDSSKHVRLQQMTIRYAPEDCQCTNVDPPLSWHLTEAEKKCIRDAGKAKRAIVCEDFVADYVNNPALAPPAICK